MLGAILAGVGLAMNVGQAVAEYGAASRQSRAVRFAAERNYEAQLADLRARLAEERTATRLRVDQARRQAARTAGGVRAQAAAAGLGGVTIGLLLGDVESQVGEFVLSAERNLEATERQIGRMQEAAAAYRDSVIAGAPTPNPLLTGLKIGAAALDTYSYFRGYTP